MHICIAIRVYKQFHYLSKDEQHALQHGMHLYNPRHTQQKIATCLTTWNAPLQTQAHTAQDLN